MKTSLENIAGNTKYDVALKLRAAHKSILEALELMRKEYPSG
jgi:hypothetical protein